MREGRAPLVRQVFLDRSGRRRRLAVLIGTSLAVALVAGLGLLVVGLSGAASVDLPGFPDRNADAPAGAPAATPPPTTRPAGPADLVGSAGDSTSGSSTTTTAIQSDRPGNGRNPSHTPSHPPKPTKNR